MKKRGPLRLAELRSKMKTCKEFCEQLSDYLDGEIGERECRLIEDHLEVCQPCALLFESLKLTVKICEQGISDEVPPEVRSRLKDFLRKHCKGYQM